MLPQASGDRPAQEQEVAAAALDRATPLHCAAAIGSRAVVELLLGCGASAGLMTAAGERPAYPVNAMLSSCILFVLWTLSVAELLAYDGTCSAISGTRSE